MIDSASRWRMVRKLRRNPKPEPGPAKIREARVEDMGLVADIYNFYVRNTVITFDEQPWDVPKWVSKFEHLQKLNMPLLFWKVLLVKSLDLPTLRPGEKKQHLERPPRIAFI